MSSIITQGYVQSNLIVTMGYGFNADTPPVIEEPPETFTITIEEATGGRASLSVGEHVYEENTVINITAVPEDGYVFSHWTTEAGVLLGSTQTVTVTENLTLTPVFNAVSPQGDYALTLANLWSNLLVKVQSQGVNTAATLHSLELGADDGVTGQPSKYWVDVACDMIITPEGVELQHYPVGSHGKLSAKAFTDVSVSDGDEVTDAFGNTWAVAEVLPYTIGGYKQLTLNLKLEDTFTHPPNPSEIIKTLEVSVVDIRNVYNLVNMEFTVITLYPANTFFPYTFPFTLA